jgi:hypothetical protein
MTKSLQQINLEFKREYSFEKSSVRIPRFSDILRAASAEFRYRKKAELEMGGVAWRVLTVKNDAILLISKEILGRRKFHGASPFRSWNESEIRAYLNGAFYDRFPAEARALIAEVANDTASAPGGEKLVSRDRIFLLSLDEARDGQYFADAEDRVAVCGGTGPWWWWLRCCGGADFDASAASDMVTAVDKNGLFNRAYTDLEMGGVRPALWMRPDGA